VYIVKQIFLPFGELSNFFFCKIYPITLWPSVYMNGWLITFVWADTTTVTPFRRA